MCFRNKKYIKNLFSQVGSRASCNEGCLAASDPMDRVLESKNDL